MDKEINGKSNVLVISNDSQIKLSILSSLKARGHHNLHSCITKIYALEIMEKNPIDEVHIVITHKQFLGNDVDLGTFLERILLTQRPITLFLYFQFPNVVFKLKLMEKIKF